MCVCVAQWDVSSTRRKIAVRRIDASPNRPDACLSSTASLTSFVSLCTTHIRVNTSDSIYSILTSVLHCFISRYCWLIVDQIFNYHQVVFSKMVRMIIRQRAARLSLYWQVTAKLYYIRAAISSTADRISSPRRQLSDFTTLLMFILIIILWLLVVVFWRINLDMC